MTETKKLKQHIVAIGVIAGITSILIHFINQMGVSFSYPGSIIDVIIVYTLSGIITFLIADKYEEHLHGQVAFQKKLSTAQLRMVYLTMYFSAILSNLLIDFFFPVFALFIPPIIGILVGISQTRSISKSTSPYTQGRTVYPDSSIKFGRGERDFSVFPSGDIMDEPEYTSHGSAHWISDWKKNFRFTEMKDGEPTYAGLWIGGGFFHHKEGNLISVAPPGSGKGGALIIPNLLWKRDYSHSFVVFDPKGTNACITARFQQEQGKKVYIIDPMGLQELNRATHGIPSANFNPLDHIVGDLFNGTAQIANLLIPDDPNGEKFWNQDARNLVQTILLHIMTDEEYEDRRSLVTFYKLMLTGSFASLFSDMIVNSSVEGTISDAAKSFEDMLLNSEKTFSSIRSVANASIKWLSNPALQACMKKSDFKPDDLERGGVAVYLCQPIQNKEGFAAFSRLVIGFCIRANSKPVSSPKAWVYYLLDEFPTMGIFPEVIECLAFSREYKMRIWLFAQSLSQLDMIYKQEGRNQILGNVGVFQAFGITDHVTQEYVSKRIGNKTVRTYTQSSSSGSSTNSSRNFQGRSDSSYGSSTNQSTNEAYHSQPLIGVEEVQYEPFIITISEWGPMRLSRWQYWEKSNIPNMYSKIFSDGRADRNPNITYESNDDY